ncbi:MAG TPA: gamma-glutamyltransferase [Methylomirabilota bacterium]|nr:gamma-glutamyltransferase [Methylomirabilota bacterium]
MPQIGYSHRPVALGREGMVASAHPYATLAGVETLKAGGTAADAAIAVNGVLAVTQPNMCGIGGDIFVLYHEATTRTVHFLNGAGRSGARASLEELARRRLPGLPVVGAATVSVPGCVRGWAMLHERFGSRPLSELLAPAIHYAERGFPASLLTSQAIDEFAPITSDPEWHRVFRPGGRAPALGELLVQQDLGRTLREIVTEGADVMYRGRAARAIADRLATDGFVTPADLADHTGEWDAPISTTYRGYLVYETPPPTQGLAALLTLNMLDLEPLARHRLHSVEHLHLLLEVVKLAYADRDRWIGDPSHARVPVSALLSTEYAARRRQAFDADKAGAYSGGDVEGDTTGFVVADARGNVAAVIQSLFNGFGSGIVVPGCGIVLQNRGRHFRLEPGHPSVLAPRKRPFHTLMASIVTRDDRPVFALSTMGGNGQAMFHTQILTNLLDYHLDPQEAIERPRFLIGAFLPGEPDDTIHLEARLPAEIFEGLRARGHSVKVAPDFFMKTGHAHAIALRDGILLGGADPRGDGAALGF